MNTSEISKLKPTDAMLEAGALCIGILADDNYGWERIKDIAREAYEAMERERLAGLVSDRAA